MERIEFVLCEKCARYEEQPDFLYVSSAELPMCATCQRYGETPHHREFPVEFLRHDKSHNTTIYIVDHDVTDTDMSDEEYYDTLAEQFEEVDNSEDISFSEWKKQQEKK